MARLFAAAVLVLAPCPVLRAQSPASAGRVVVTVGTPDHGVLSDPRLVQGPKRATAVTGRVVWSPVTRTVPSSHPPRRPLRATRTTLSHQKPVRRARTAKKALRVVRDLGVMRVTEYCATGNRTASGVWPRIGQVATLDRHMPFGTKLRLLGKTTGGRLIDQTFIVTDRIGHGSQVDIYQGGVGDPGCEPRVNRLWGVQHLRVEVVR